MRRSLAGDGMRVPPLLTVVAIGLALATGCLILAAVLDAPALRLVAVACIVAVFLVREALTWRGHGRAWLAMAAVLLLVIAVSFLAQRLT